MARVRYRCAYAGSEPTRTILLVLPRGTRPASLPGSRSSKQGAMVEIIAQDASSGGKDLKTRQQHHRRSGYPVRTAIHEGASKLQRALSMAVQKFFTPAVGGDSIILYELRTIQPGHLTERTTETAPPCYVKTDVLTFPKATGIATLNRERTRGHKTRNTPAETKHTHTHTQVDSLVGFREMS